MQMELAATICGGSRAGHASLRITDQLAWMSDDARKPMMQH
jgi:hypothetical protein